MVFCEDFFELLTEVAGVGGAGAFGADGYVEVVTPYCRGHEEITMLRVVDDVAEDFKLLAVPIDLFVDFAIVGGGDGEEGLVEVFDGVLRFDKLDVFAAGELGGEVVQRLINDDDSGAGFDKDLGLSNRYGTTPNDDRSPSANFQKYRELSHQYSLYTRRL